MNHDLQKFLIEPAASNLEALKKIGETACGFLLVAEAGKLLGTLTDGDMRRAFVSGKTMEDPVQGEYSENCHFLFIDDGLLAAADLFKQFKIEFIPIVDREKNLENLITRNQLHSLLLQDIQAGLDYDFSQVDDRMVDDEIYTRPWGFYKTTVTNEYFKAKIISIKPRQSLSLQYHNRRQEFWLIVHGRGVVCLDESVFEVSTGSSVFVPKGCKHRVTNSSETESLLISEVQTGEYFGEDDIIRLEDNYGRGH